MMRMANANSSVKLESIGIPLRPAKNSAIIQNMERCLGEQANEILGKYRKRVIELEAVGKADPDMKVFKSDMKAFSELVVQQPWYEEPQNKDPYKRHPHGEIVGVPIGLTIQSRGEAAILGLHQKISCGIDAIKGESCYAVCLSGVYADDSIEFDSVSGIITRIYYTGEGGQDTTKRQVEDQKRDRVRVANDALKLSAQTGRPIRVICRRDDHDGGRVGQASSSSSRHHRFQYLGLYRCVGYTYEDGIDGMKVFKFELVPMMTTRNDHDEKSPRERKNQKRDMKRENVKMEETQAEESSVPGESWGDQAGGVKREPEAPQAEVPIKREEECSSDQGGNQKKRPPSDLLPQDAAFLDFKIPRKASRVKEEPGSHQGGSGGKRVKEEEEARSDPGESKKLTKRSPSHQPPRDHEGDKNVPPSHQDDAAQYHHRGSQSKFTSEAYWKYLIGLKRGSLKHTVSPVSVQILGDQRRVEEQHLCNHNDDYTMTNPSTTAVVTPNSPKRTRRRTSNDRLDEKLRKSEWRR